VEQYATVDRLLGSEPMAQAPVDFCATLMASIAALPAPRRLSESQKARNDFRTMMGLLLLRNYLEAARR